MHACVRACVRACVCAWVRACTSVRVPWCHWWSWSRQAGWAAPTLSSEPLCPPPSRWQTSARGAVDRMSKGGEGKRTIIIIGKKTDLGSYGIELVNEDNCRALLFGQGESISHHLGSVSYKHLWGIYKRNSHKSSLAKQPVILLANTKSRLTWTNWGPASFKKADYKRNTSHHSHHCLYRGGHTHTCTFVCAAQARASSVLPVPGAP